MDSENLKEKLFNKKKNGWINLDSKENENINKFAQNYINFLNEGKTEREIIKISTKIARENGFKSIEDFETLKKGDKVYFVNKGKSMYLAVIGENDISDGINIIGSHADSPRLDLKPNPLYEDTELAFLKTQYYGGIKRYQWTNVPLSIHGVISKTNGETIEVNIGEDDNDPIFTVPDLLIHLSKEQLKKTLDDGITGEDLNLLIGSIPFDDKTSESVKLNILNILNKKYGITEADFLSSELELVPSFKARSLGFDGGLIAGYGQDDKVCVFTSLSAMMKINNPKTTAVCIISDKEEIGSMGNTGMESNIFDTFIAEILNKMNINKPNLLDKVFCNSRMLSADVTSGINPLFPQVYERNNAARISYGLGLSKYTGGRGKSGSSDANAEFIAKIRKLFESNKIPYQITELGKIDAGGGATISYILANKGIDVIDCGVPVLSMHSPYEITSKFDVYCAYVAYTAFWQE
ncbi:MAG: aminopeptidase [Clostridia bacterium]|nr:aminopeptidase [Clostridia bacterium]